MSTIAPPRPRPPGSKPGGQATVDPWRDPTAIPLVRIEGVTKRFEAGAAPAVDNVDLAIFKGEFFALLGGSGSGKTTLLRMLAGFERPTEGKIWIDGVDVSDVPPYERPVNMMFQSYALFPHLSVEANIAFGLKQERLDRAEIKRRVQEGLDLVQLAPYAKRRPDQLSGGQRQRVALARSLVKRPKLLLLDEPLGALDKRLREKTQVELAAIQDRLGVTFIMVTHDQEEAMTLACRIAVMNEGRIAQIGTPTEIYEFPASRLVASFVGSINLFEGRVASIDGNEAALECDQLGGVKVNPAAGARVGEEVAIAVRPEKIRIHRAPPNQGFNQAEGVIVHIGYLGDISIYHVKLADGTILIATQANLERWSEPPFTWDDIVWLSWAPEAGVLLTA